MGKPALIVCRESSIGHVTMVPIPLSAAGQTRVQHLRHQGTREPVSCAQELLDTIFVILRISLCLESMMCLCRLNMCSRKKFHHMSFLHIFLRLAHMWGQPCPLDLQLLHGNVAMRL
eukprot:3045344-Amphidinium_carterae.1